MGEQKNSTSSSAPRASNQREAALEDVRLIRRVAAGDAKAFGQLYRRHRRLLSAFALRRLGNSAEVDDLVQDVFAEVWRDAAKYDSSRGSVRRWLLLLLRSRAYDGWRRRRARGAGKTQHVDPDEIGAERPLHTDRLTVDSVLARLPTSQRDVALLHYCGGMTSREIAERISVPLGTVKSRMRTAREKLTHQLASHLSLQPTP